MFDPARSFRACTFALVLLVLHAGPAAAQALRARIDAAPAGTIEFSYAAAPGVCGNGRGYIRTDAGVTIVGTFSDMSAESCVPGPVRVRLDRDGRNIIAVRTFVGPRADDAAGSDLGIVAPQQAAGFLLDLAAHGEGRIGRDAVTAAALADSVAIFDGLIALARNHALPRETRTAALSNVPRAAAAQMLPPARVVQALLTVARDEQDNPAVRRQGLGSLSRLEQGAGMPTLLELADSRQQDGWLAREAMNVVAASGDPRARAHLRAVAQRDNESQELRRIAIRAIGQRYTNAQDAALLRSLYTRVDAPPLREAVIAAIAGIGGADNVSWLVDVARDAREPLARRRTALDQAARAGARVTDLIRLYDTVGEHQLKEVLVTIFGRSEEPAALMKLIEIARGETNVNVRRRAITTLSNSGDPRARAVLLELIRS